MPGRLPNGSMGRRAALADQIWFRPFKVYAYHKTQFVTIACSPGNSLLAPKLTSRPSSCTPAMLQLASGPPIATSRVSYCWGGLLQSSSLVVVRTGGNPTRISRLLYCRAVIKRKVSFINVDEDSQLCRHALSTLWCAFHSSAFCIFSFHLPRKRTLQGGAI